MQSAANEISEVIGNNVRIATTELKLREDSESGGGIGVKHRGGQLRNMFGAWEAKQLFNICSAQRIHAGGEKLVKHRLGVTHSTIGESSKEGDRLWLRVALLRLQDLGQLADDLVLRNRSEVKSLEARKDRGANARRVRGAEDKDDARRWLFEPLQ
jgi:hypothetical protein